MKKIFLALLMLLSVSVVFSQATTKGVNFADKTLPQALEEASQNNKLVFCNFSTSWCGPCKTMREKVYPDSEVAEFINSKFVSLYIDAEAKEWVEVAKKYRITGYPTIVILDSEGKEKGRVVGAQGKEQLIDRLSIILDDSRSPEGLKRRYDSGERTPQLINDYAMLYMRSGNEIMGYEIVDNYFNSLDNASKVAQENWFLYHTYAVRYNDIRSRYLIDNYKEFYSTIGKDVVDEEVYRILRLESCGYLSGYLVDKGDFVREDYEKIKADIEKTDITKKNYLIASLRVSEERIKCGLDAKTNFASFIKVAKKEFSNLERRDCMILVSNLSNIAVKSSNRVKKEAIELIERYKATYDYQRNPRFDVLAKTIKILTPTQRGDMIAFMDISFDEAVAKAKKTGKLIFIDCYTVWCGPCKVLSEQVFTVTDVKKFFDKNFINLKIDMEKGEGPELAKRFKIRSYPTLLLVNGDGEIVDTLVGTMGFKEFLDYYQKAYDKLSK